MSTTNPFAPRPPSPRAAAKIAASEESASNLRKILKPEAAAARLGFDSLAEIEEQIPERLRPHVTSVIEKGSFTIGEIGRASDGSGNPPTKAMILARITERCQQADNTAIGAAESTARWNNQHQCAVTGQVDNTTRRRRTPWGQVLMVSDVGEAAITRAWAESFPTTIMDTARALIPTTTEQPAPKRKRSA